MNTAPDVQKRGKTKRLQCFFVGQIQEPPVTLFINKLRINKSNKEVSCVLGTLSIITWSSFLACYVATQQQRPPANEALANKVNFCRDSTAFSWASCLCFSPCCVSPTAKQKQYCTLCVHAKRRMQMDLTELVYKRTLLGPTHSLSLSTSKH